MFKVIYNNPKKSFFGVILIPIILIVLWIWILCIKDLNNQIAFASAIVAYFSFIWVIFLTVFVPKIIQEWYDKNKEKQFLYITFLNKIQEEIKEAEMIMIQQTNNNAIISKETAKNLLKSIKTRIWQKKAEIDKINIKSESFNTSLNTYYQELIDDLEKEDYVFSENHLSKVLTYWSLLDGEIETFKVTIKISVIALSEN